jgi:hypothetical protein
LFHAHAALSGKRERTPDWEKDSHQTTERISPTSRGRRATQECGSNSLVGSKLAWLIRKQNRLSLEPVLQHCHYFPQLHLSQLTKVLRKKRMQPKEEGQSKMVLER